MSFLNYVFRMTPINNMIKSAIKFFIILKLFYYVNGTNDGPVLFLVVILFTLLYFDWKDYKSNHPTQIE